jgi:hypothetical protein
VIETDYLVVGAGAAGMAFADALIAACDADVVLVDRRHAPGGHWNDAYPFVRLHQPSATYGVNSRELGSGSIDDSGPNAGFYELARGGEICEYFQGVLDEALLPSGRVRFFGGCDYVGDWSGEHAFASRLSGATTEVRVRRKIVDTTYLQVQVPATHTPAFEIDADIRFIPVGELVDVAEARAGFTVLGAGKTGMDACNWLLANGVDPEGIRWVKPRDAWVLERASCQTLDLVVPAIEGLSVAVEAMAQAENVDDLFRRLESAGQIARIDPTVEPTMFRGAILSEGERASLRQIERVVRLGRVLGVIPDRVVLEHGEVPAAPGEVFVDCTASGFRTAPATPIFEPDKITLQSLLGGYTTYNAALVGFIESARSDDAEKNRLCPPTPQPSVPTDWIHTYSGGFKSFALHSAEPDIAAWIEASRLSLTRGMSAHLDDPRMQSALARWITNLEPALTNGDALLASAPSLV